MKTITAFARPAVLPAPARLGWHRTRRQISRVRVVERVVALLVAIRLRNAHRNTTETGVLREWTRKTRQLIRELDDPVPALRVLRVVAWYARQDPGWNHSDDKMMPRVDSGGSLYDKFNRLEACMLARTWRAPSVAETVGALFNGSRVLADSFTCEILPGARALRLGAPEPELAAKLGALLEAIRAARNGAAASAELPGPLSLLGRYLDWLRGQEWTMTTRVLDARSAAFARFRREAAAQHPRGLDPLTGRS